MPCLSLQYDPRIGPLINLFIAKPASVRTAAIAQGLLVPGPAPPPAQLAQVFACVALIDTGASLTCVTAPVAQQAGLLPSGKMPMSSASGVSAANTYIADVVLPFTQFAQPTAPQIMGGFAMESVTIMEFQCNSPHFQALLGRDILCRGILQMGFDQRFTFSI